MLCCNIVDRKRSPRGPAATGPQGWSPNHPQDKYTPVFYIVYWVKLDIKCSTIIRESGGRLVVWGGGGGD